MGMMQGMMGGKGGMMKPGDWKCFGCNNINYASRDACNKCGIPKDNFIARSGMRPGDWFCPDCKNHNYADKVNCNKCQRPKGDAPTQPGKNMRPGDWMCPSCNNHNYADKAACNRCKQPKGHVEEWHVSG